MIASPWQFLYARHDAPRRRRSPLRSRAVSAAEIGISGILLTLYSACREKYQHDTSVARVRPLRLMSGSFMSSALLFELFRSSRPQPGHEN